MKSIKSIAIIWDTWYQEENLRKKLWDSASQYEIVSAKSVANLEEEKKFDLMVILSAKNESLRENNYADNLTMKEKVYEDICNKVWDTLIVYTWWADTVTEWLHAYVREKNLKITAKVLNPSFTAQKEQWLTPRSPYEEIYSIIENVESE